MDQKALRQIEQIVGYKFSDKRLLDKAFTHSSAVDDRILSNERLEFLGDSVLAVVICQALFDRFSSYLEGDLTKIKSKLVSRETCARVCGRLELQKFLKVGKGMVSNRALSGSLAAGALETVIAAIYIDGGFEPAREFILRVFGSLIEESDAEQVQGNFKSLLQQHAQEQFSSAPSYVLLDEKGPDHNKCFELEVVIDDRHFTSAWGTNKKEAEQKAALNALVELGVLEEAAAEDGF
ncbi:MAG: ribonuclease III [Planctomycetes bacterium B3_Pla]|nr:MAG: ribonuclease III [Planctomycetes bacterium B3_Pla]